MTVLTERIEGATCHLTLNRPEAGNALSAELVARLQDAVCRHAELGTQTLVLQGEGKHFCTGFDLSHLDAESDDALLARFVRIELLLQSIATAPFHTVVLAQGRVMGAGADLFVACQRRIASSNAIFAFPGAKGFGLVLGTHRLAVRVGVEVAEEWVTSGRLIDVEEALARGLASQRQCEALDEGERVAFEAGREADAGGHAAQLVQRALYQASDADRDLGLLARSAAVPGLKKRIEDYVRAVKAQRA